MPKNIFLFSYDKKLVKNHKIINIDMPLENNQDALKHAVLKICKKSS